VKLAIQLGLLSAINILITFLFQCYVIIHLGVGIETDALFASMTVPQLVLVVISSSLMHVLVPFFSGVNEIQLRRDAWGFLVVVGGLFGILAIILYAMAPFWVPMTVPGFSTTGKSLAIALTRIQLIGMVLTAINGVQWAAYHARRKFLQAELTPVIAGAIGFALLMWLLPHFGIFAAAWINIFQIALQTLLLSPSMGRPIRVDLKSQSILEAWLRIKPLLIGAAYYKTEPVIDRFLLSMTGAGNISLYYLGQQLYGAVSLVLNKAIMAPLVPILSTAYKMGDKMSFRRNYNRNFYYLGIISLLTLVIFIFFGHKFLTLLVGHRNISKDNIDQLFWIMIWLSGMFLGGTLGQLTSVSFYARTDTSTPTRIGIYTYTLFVPAKFILFYMYGIKGLAIATSIFFISNFLLQHVFTIRKFNDLV
jgi:peptidoglycan biosynthesis protein MviN/MurJ (putative lipid II flippase)